MNECRRAQNKYGIKQCRRKMGNIPRCENIERCLHRVRHTLGILPSEWDQLAKKWGKNFTVSLLKLCDRDIVEVTPGFYTMSPDVRSVLKRLIPSPTKAKEKTPRIITHIPDTPTPIRPKRRRSPDGTPNGLPPPAPGRRQRKTPKKRRTPIEIEQFMAEQAAAINAAQRAMVRDDIRRAGFGTASFGRVKKPKTKKRKSLKKQRKPKKHLSVLIN